MPSPQPPLGHVDSIDSQDPNLHGENTKQKSRRPANTAFRQQRLKAWQPILTPKTVLPLFFAIGIIFAPIGGLLYYASSTVEEIIIDYSRCDTDAPLYPDVGTLPSNLVDAKFKQHSDSYNFQTSSVVTWSRQDITSYYGNTSTGKMYAEVPATLCTLNFTIPNDLGPPVLFYYKLTNFYQNHRRYAKSFNSDQLSGKAVSASTIQSGDCSPLTTNDTTGLPYYPCGLAPNSVFNDTFSNPINLSPPNSAVGPSNETYYMTNSSDISWESDKELYGQSAYASNWSQVSVPPNWIKRYPNGYSEEYHPDLVNDEAFQVWMRLAGLPIFSKLAQRNDTVAMGKGPYTVDIAMHFPVTEYGGTKSIIISTRSVIGGKNNFLGIAYIVVGGLCILLGAVFTVTHLIKPRKLGDHTYLSWNNEQPSTATTSGRDHLPGEAGHS